MYVFTIDGDTTSPHTRREAAMLLAEELGGTEVKVRRERAGAFVSGTVVELAAEAPASVEEAEVLLDFGADEVARVGVIGTSYTVEIRRTAEELDRAGLVLERARAIGGEWALDDGKLTIGIDEELAEKLAED